jgi:hypothetical protein
MIHAWQTVCGTSAGGFWRNISNVFQLDCEV